MREAAVQDGLSNRALTSRERQALWLVARGDSDKGIGADTLLQAASQTRCVASPPKDLQRRLETRLNIAPGMKVTRLCDAIRRER